ncbi:thymidylate kinase-domain-containing protein [Lipomyces arxii]|uniref:thymidylate kinase-domain-containing protein n=1 Tax=Lipomyces arxii TaxID=56418 RepID=UPI0034CF95CA
MTVTRGLLIAVEGLDRAGKTTQCQRLCDHFNKTGNARIQKMPDRTTQIGQAINGYLTSSTQLPDQTIHLLFSSNRWELAESILASLNAGQTVILDRYVPSGVAYSLAKEVPGMNLEWCLAPEIGLPCPDITLFLDIDPNKADLQTSRADFGNERYEVSEFQAKVRNCFKIVLGDNKTGGQAKLGPVVVIDAAQSLDGVTADIQSAIGKVKVTNEIGVI